ncbi:hypothetical protein [Gluconobacter cerinus]|uniref:hypothetical protein n=1 Tax=Gluconobacter cerinus TaxID=38307 RepID=UPI001C03F178|nr:hypothetical protein [Gluconobacter cerinus]
MSQILPAAKPGMTTGGGTFPVGTPLASKERFQDFLKSYVHEKSPSSDCAALSRKNTPRVQSEKNVQTNRGSEVGKNQPVSTENREVSRSLKPLSSATKVSAQPVRSNSLPENSSKIPNPVNLARRGSELSAHKVSTDASFMEAPEVSSSVLQNHVVDEAVTTDEPDLGQHAQCASDLEDDNGQSSMSDLSPGVASFDGASKSAVGQCEVKKDPAVSETESVGVGAPTSAENIHVLQVPNVEASESLLELPSSELQNSGSEHTSVSSATRDEGSSSSLNGPVVTHQATDKRLNTQIDIFLEHDGKIRMSVAEDKGGERHIHILAENSEALRSLSTNKESLLSSLNQNLVSVSADQPVISTEVSFGLLGSFSQDYPTNSGRDEGQQRPFTACGSSETSSEDLSENASVSPRKFLRGVVDLTA